MFKAVRSSSDTPRRLQLEATLPSQRREAPASLRPFPPVGGADACIHGNPTSAQNASGDVRNVACRPPPVRPTISSLDPLGMIAVGASECPRFGCARDIAELASSGPCAGDVMAETQTVGRTSGGGYARMMVAALRRCTFATGKGGAGLALASRVALERGRECVISGHVCLQHGMAHPNLLSDRRSRLSKHGFLTETSKVSRSLCAVQTPPRAPSRHPTLPSQRPLANLVLLLMPNPPLATTSLAFPLPGVPLPLALPSPTPSFTSTFSRHAFTVSSS